MFFIVRHEPLGRRERVRPTTRRVPAVFGRPFATYDAAAAEAARRYDSPWRIVSANHLGEVIARAWSLVGER